jgi:hypothetical protein
MGVMICRFSNSVDDGIYWVGDSSPPKDSYTLYDVMERYLTTGETMEILCYDPCYDPYDASSTTKMLTNEREAHKETHHAY